MPACPMTTAAQGPLWNRGHSTRMPCLSPRVRQGAFR